MFYCDYKQMAAKSSDSIKVAIKVRPLLRREKDTNCWWKIIDNSIQLVESQSDPYYFDYIFDQNAANEIIFGKMAKHIVHSAVRGFNGTIFAYGQTSSGKTYTMMGDEKNPGVMILAVKEIFNEIQKATDRQFLLRVGYIEIYNEKIYDLLNKKNQDLKIHETPTGIVSVNCEECIIMCEDDLLNYLNMGNKERTVGETNMNERSSRSHAIFRIIIESRKIERTDDDDAVIQSVLNLVDLAGSERADQTGARGTRLKEGGHINKSLLFLSNVIKRLSENEDDKYISYRDSKLTRILQASLGGNALTSIICTIKPNAIEETQSTLSFAMRAKSIKNKPQLNEIVSDATMMKRLEREIQDLKACLDKERRKNESTFKVGQLEERIKNEVLKIITCNSLLNIRSQREKRRRTWCGEACDMGVPPMASGNYVTRLPIPKLNTFSNGNYPTRLPKPSTHFTPLITMRITPENEFNSNNLRDQTVTEEIEEDFVPGELCSFGTAVLKTPEAAGRNSNNLLQMSITPNASAVTSKSLESIEHALLELQEFTNLENKIDVKHETYEALKQKLESVMNRNEILERDRLEYIELKDEVNVTKQSIIDYEQRCDDLQIQISKLTNLNQTANDKIVKYEEELAQLKENIEKIEIENREAVSLDFEFQIHKNKSKLREAELLELLAEKQKEITKLEKSLESITEEKIQGSKEELLQVSQSAESNDDGNVCIKCVDLQRLLDENSKVIYEFEKINLEYNQLELLLKEAQSKVIELNEEKFKNEEQIDNLCKKLDMLQQIFEKTELKYKESNSENNEIRTNCEDLKQTIRCTHEEMHILQEKYNNLENAWQEQQQMIASIQEEYSVVQNKYTTLQGEYDKLEYTSAQSLEDCVRLQRENNSVQDEIVELKRRAEVAQQQLLIGSTDESTNSNEMKKIADLEQSLEEIKRQYEVMQTEYNDLSNQLMDSLQDNETLRTQNTKLQMEVHSVTSNSIGNTNKITDNSRPSDDCSKGDYKEIIDKLEKLQSEVNEKNALLNATEHTLSEMQEQMTTLQAELFEKSVYIEKCEEMRNQIENLEKERAEMSIVCEELQEKVKDSGNDTVCKQPNNILIEEKIVDDNENIANLKQEYEDHLNGLQSKLREQELIIHAKSVLIKQLEEKLNEREKYIETLLIHHKEKLEEVKQSIKAQDKSYKSDVDGLQLELLQKLEDSETQFRENLKKYNQEWEVQRDSYEQTIAILNTKLKSQTSSMQEDSCVNKAAVKAEEGSEENRYEKQESDLIDNQKSKTNANEELVKVEKIICQGCTEHAKVIEEKQNLFKKYESLIKENENQMIKIENQATELSSLHKIKNEFENKLVGLKVQVEAAKEFQLLIEEKKQSLSAQIEELKYLQQKEIQQFQSTIGKLKEDISILLQKRNETEESERRLVTDLIASKAECNNLCKQNSELSESIAKLSLQLKEAEIKYNDKLNQLEVSNNEKNEINLQKLENLVEENNIKIDFLETNNQLLEKTISGLTAKHIEEQNQLLEKIEALNNELEIIKASKIEISNELNILEKKFQEVQMKCQIIENDKIKLNETLLKLNDETRNNTTTYQSSINMLESKLLQVEKDKEILNIDLKALQLNFEQEKEENSKLKLSLEKLNTDLKALEDIKTKLEGNYDDIKNENLIISKDLETFKLENNKLLHGNLELSEALKKSTAGQLSAEVHLKNLTENDNERSTRMSQLKAELEKISAERDNLELCISVLNEEQEKLNTLIEQNIKEKLLLKEKEETLELKIESLSQQLQEAQINLKNCENLLVEHENLKTLLQQTAEEKIHLDNELHRLKTLLAETKDNEQSCKNTSNLEILKLEKQLLIAREENDNLIKNEKLLIDKLKKLEETLVDERLLMDKQNQNIQSSLNELKIKCKSLEESKSLLQQTNDSLESSYYQLNKLLDSKVDEFKETKGRLEETINCLILEKKNFEEKLFLTEEILKKLERDRETALKKCESANTSLESSLGERNSPRRKCANEKPASKQSLERKNRRLSVHDDNRRQSSWGSTRDVGLMTDPADTNCNCIELDQKLKEHEKQLFIRESQVTALNLELKNHPLKAENAALVKRLQDEQEKNRNEIKRYKCKLIEQTSKINELTCKIGSKLLAETENISKSEKEKEKEKELNNAETQTEFDVYDSLDKLQSKYEDLKSICRSRYNEIRNLEEKLSQKENTDCNAPLSSLEAGHIKVLKSQCESLKKDVKQLQNKYETAKKVLHMRRVEIEGLREQLNQITTHSAAV